MARFGERIEDGNRNAAAPPVGKVGKIKIQSLGGWLKLVVPHRGIANL